MKKSFPLTKPLPAGSERRYLDEVLRSEHWAGGGTFTLRCEREIERAINGTASAFLTQSCTAALEMGALVLGLGKGDEVIMPSFTFASSANAVVLRGATPVFIDVRSDTLNIDEMKIEEAITPRTRAIMVVHYGGVCCNLDPIGAIATKHSLSIIEDAAQAYLSSYRGSPAGALGTVGGFSFHETKNSSCGEGGAFTTTSATLAKSAEVIRDKGTNRAQFLRGEVEKYTWVDIGSSYLPSEFQAAVLLAQLENARRVTEQRVKLWNAYYEAFAELEQRGLIERPVVPPECQHNAHIFRLMLRTEGIRDAVMAELRQVGIGAASHLVPLHSSVPGRRFGRTIGALEVTEDAANCLLRLPLQPDINADLDIERIIECTLSAIEKTA